MIIGDICNFGIGDGNHICVIEIMDITLVGMEPPYRKLIKCRRINNGSKILAWEEDLERRKNDGIK